MNFERLISRIEPICLSVRASARAYVGVSIGCLSGTCQGICQCICQSICQGIFKVSVRASRGKSVAATVCISVKTSLGIYVGASVRASVGVFVEPSVMTSIDLNCIMCRVFILSSQYVGLIKKNLLTYNSCCLICKLFSVTLLLISTNPRLLFALIYECCWYCFLAVCSCYGNHV